jgi:phosphate transport system substrate-binding protein
MQSRTRGPLVTVGAVLAMAVGVAACSSSSSTPAASSSGGSTSTSVSGTINAAGSTFQTDFQQAAIQEFKSTDAGITVNYGGGGSGTGRADLYKNSVLFAGSDSPIPSKEASEVPAGKTVLYFPVLIGPIAVTYNLPGVATGLKLNASVLAQIFQGEITTWNNSSIAALNPGVKLPSTAITLAVRSDSSGTTQNFSLYFTKAAPSVWKLGSASTIKWPSSAHAGDGNPGVAQVVKSTPGAIGYVDYTDAKASSLTYAAIQNSAGKWVEPTPAGASASAATASVASDLTFAATDGSEPTAYPISYQTWDLVYAKQPNANDAALLKAYLGYLLGAGQQLLPSLSYASLPSSLDAKAKAQLNKITG